MQDFIQKLNPQGGIAQFNGTGSPEGVVTGYVGNNYLDTSTADLYQKASGDNTNSGWTVINNKIQGVQNSLVAVTVNTFTPTTIASVIITPRNASNVILLLATGDGNPNQTGGFHFLRLYRNATALDPYVIIENSGVISINQPFSLSKIDNPNTTSAITYTVKAYQGSGSYTYGEGGNSQATRLIALEFAPA